MDKAEQPTITQALKPCPFCQAKATWRPMTEELEIPFGVLVDHAEGCWLNYEKTLQSSFDDLPERWNTRSEGK